MTWINVDGLGDTELIRRFGKRFQLHDLTLEELALIVPHQMNGRLIESVADRLAIPRGKLILNIEDYGNTSGASAPLTACHTLGDAPGGDEPLCLFAGFGVGFAWGGALVRLRSQCVFSVRECP